MQGGMSMSALSVFIGAFPSGYLYKSTKRLRSFGIHVWHV
jgi:hypothetical protein